MKRTILAGTALIALGAACLMAQLKPKSEGRSRCLQRAGHTPPRAATTMPPSRPRTICSRSLATRNSRASR